MKICQVSPLLKALKLLLSKHLTLASKALPPNTESPHLFSLTGMGPAALCPRASLSALFG